MVVTEVNIQPYAKDADDVDGGIDDDDGCGDEDTGDVNEDDAFVDDGEDGGCSDG